MFELVNLGPFSSLPLECTWTLEGLEKAKLEHVKGNGKIKEPSSTISPQDNAMTFSI